MTNLLPLLLLQSDFSSGGEPVSNAAFIGIMVFWLALMVLMVAAMWRIFTKAGQPGWAALIPIYNIVVLLQIAGRPVWWLLLMLIPFVNFVVMIVLCIDVAKSFGKGAGFGLGLLFLSPIFYPLLAWGDASYKGPAAATA